MTPSNAALVHELSLVERAREGDHAAFVELYRQDAPPAWRLALALSRDADAAAEAVTDAFRRVLAPLRPGAATSDLPFRIRLLTATRHASLDARPDIAQGLADSSAPPPAPTEDASILRPREVMDAFYALPERWRTILWLLTVEGVGSLDASRVLRVAAGEAEDIAVRAHSGLRQQWRKGHPDGGAAPAHLERQLQPLLPLPLTLFDAAQQRWSRARTRGAGPLGLVLPGGRPVPGWAERALVTTTALLIAAGITGAVVADPDSDRRPGVRVARQADDTDGDGSDDDATDGGDARRSFADTFDFADDVGASVDGGSGTPVADVAARSAVPAPGSGPSTASIPPEPDDDAPPTTTTTKPLLQIDLGLGRTVALGLGACTGLELLGSTLGCPPDTPDDGVTVDVESSLLPG